MGEEEEDAPKRKRFRDKADLRLGVIEQTNVEGERGRERDKQKSTNTDQYKNIVK